MEGEMKESILKMFRSIFYRLFSILLVISFVISGCGSPSGQAPAAQGAKKIVVWHWMTDRDKALQELAKGYEQKTGVEVVFELYAPSDQYSQKVRAAAQGDSLPDIFGILGEKRDFASFIKAGYVINLSPYYEEMSGSWKNKFFREALAVNEFLDGNIYSVAPGIYGVPIDITTIKMLYNKDLFKELGLDPDRPPATFQEFIEIGKKIHAAGGSASGGMQGLISGWAEVWMIDCLANNYAFNIMGKDKVLATMRGEVPYTDPDWIRVLSLFKEMQESGILAQGIVTMDNKTAEQLFANQKAVFAFNGSWCVNVYRGMNPNLNYAAMLPPRATDKYPMAIWKGAGSSFMVNARSKNKEEAVKFLRWLTDSDQQAYLSQSTSNLPANKECLGKISPFLAQFAEDKEPTTHPNIWGVSESPLVLETLSKGIQSIVIGEKAPEQVAQEVQSVKEREQAKIVIRKS
jgi:ABC-type glycerol-3-phosphate transport system substrate-binding protein